MIIFIHAERQILDIKEIIIKCLLECFTFSKYKYQYNHGPLLLSCPGVVGGYAYRVRIGKQWRKFSSKTKRQ